MKRLVGIAIVSVAVCCLIILWHLALDQQTKDDVKARATGLVGDIANELPPDTPDAGTAPADGTSRPGPSNSNAPPARPIVLPRELGKVDWGMSRRDIERHYHINWTRDDDMLVHYPDAARERMFRFHIGAGGLRAVDIVYKEPDAKALAARYESIRADLAKRYAGEPVAGPALWSDGHVKVKIERDARKKHCIVIYERKDAR